MGVQVRCGCTANAGHNYKGVAFNTHAVQRLRHVLLPARAPKEPVHRLRHGLLPARAPEESTAARGTGGLLPARAPEGPVQGLRHGREVPPVVPKGLLPARAPEGPVQGLRYGLLQARAPEGPVQGLLNAAAASPAFSKPPKIAVAPPF